MPAVQLDRVDAHYDSTQALDAVSLSVERGSLTAVIGPNGSGKSTMFAVISGRLRPSSGHVHTDGPVADVLQATAIDPELRLTVNDVVRMGRYPNRGLLRPMRAIDRDACDNAIERMGLEPLRKRPINELSGGQRQRALVAQGLAQQAPVLLLDEPASGLDAPSQQRILDAMRDEADAGRTVLFSTHQLDDTDHADTVVALACRCVCCAPPSIALTDPDVTTLFG
jgi:zinc/manganese transport system ATP-binding protein